MPLSDPRLLPCPFCNGTPVLWVIPFHGWCVECERCGITLSKYQETEVKTTKEDAIAFWNRRPGMGKAVAA